MERPETVRLPLEAVTPSPEYRLKPYPVLEVPPMLMLPVVVMLDAVST